jgi:hypothetical protein
MRLPLFDEDNVKALRAIHRRYLDRKRALDDEVRTGRATAAWAAEEQRRAHEQAKKEKDAYLQNGIETDLRKRIDGMEGGIVWRRPDNPDLIVEKKSGALDRVLSEVEFAHGNPAPDPSLALLATADLERRAATAPILEVSHIRTILRGREEGHQSETVREAARMALHGVEHRARALALEEKVVQTRTREWPRLKQVLEHLQYTARAIDEDVEDPGPRFEMAAAVSDRRARGEIGSPTYHGDTDTMSAPASDGRGTLHFLPGGGVVRVRPPDAA